MESKVLRVPYVVDINGEYYSEAHSDTSDDSIDNLDPEKEVKPKEKKPHISEIMKTLNDEEKVILKRQIKEELPYKLKYRQNHTLKKEVNAKIEKKLQESAELQEEIDQTRAEIKETKEKYDITMKKLEETEMEIEDVKALVEKQLRVQKQIAEIKKEKEDVEQKCRITTNAVKNLQTELLHKVEEEKEVMADFQENVDIMTLVINKLEVHDLLSPERLEQAKNQLIDWKMQLALHEDSNIEEIMSLSD